MADNQEGESRKPRKLQVEFLTRWPATVAAAGAIAILNHLPPADLPEVPLFLHADKLIHFVEYLVLGALLFRSLRHELYGNSVLAAIMTCVVGATFAALDEWLQAEAGRSPDLLDALADIAGLLFGMACVLILAKGRSISGERTGVCAHHAVQLTQEPDGWDHRPPADAVGS